MINWGILGAGSIARVFCNGLRFSKTGRLTAVASRTPGKADALADLFDVDKRYTEYEAMLADPDIDAVYVANIHPVHAKWVIRTAEAGKHILVEKPIGMNAPEAAAMIGAAGEHDVFLMEAFMYRCHPQIAKMVSLIQSGAIGEVKMIRSAFGYQAGFNPDGRTYNNELGGGGILDVGCYPASIVRLIAGAAAGEPFLDPIEVSASGHIGPTGVDHYTAATLKFQNEIVAEIATAVGVNIPGEAVIYGTEGILTVPNPWLPSSPARGARAALPLDTTFPSSTLLLQKGGETTEIEVKADRDLFSYEADMVGEHIVARQAPAMSWDDTLGNMKLLDRWRSEIGVTYEQEKRFRPGTIAGRPLKRRANARMQYGRIPGLDKRIARLVQGADRNVTLPYSEVMFDTYYEQGGNIFDCSLNYGGGRCQANLGNWIRARGLEDDVIVLHKGGNPPNGHPDGIRRELEAGLAGLGMDSVDIWLMHRDSPQVPVGEIVDVLNEQQAAGRCTIFGVSNWSLSRLKEAQQYAVQNGRNFFYLVSNQFSLARIQDVWWDSAVSKSVYHSSSEPEFRSWFEQLQMPLVPWSSQASGFFVERPARGPDPFDIERCWHSPDNFERRRRARTLAAEKGVQPVEIALAWTLNQPFPVFPIIGPTQPAETLSCIRALDIVLSQSERAWLDLAGER